MRPARAMPSRRALSPSYDRHESPDRGREGSMKLSALAPRWVGITGWSSQKPFYVGLSFLCPHCGRGPCPECGHSRDHRLAVAFWPPIDPENAAADFAVPILDNGGHRRISGETFDTLTLKPSIGFDDPPHFHGTITEGDVTNQYTNAPWVQAL